MVGPDVGDFEGVTVSSFTQGSVVAHTKIFTTANPNMNPTALQNNISSALIQNKEKVKERLGLNSDLTEIAVSPPKGR